MFSFLGTYIYMAPEVIRCEPYNEKCDVYSFGIILNELITGQYPYIDSNYSPMKGVLGIKVKIMLDWDPKGKQGLTPALPDPSTPQKEEDEYMRPSLLVNDIDIAA
eukprot:TRINITY_DN7698_c0_g1_i4.p1 TRINITY_DN7698_c0_g1~~TRINITY_DN7698_c0_g1_i4.p1  ORF type:complete len:106 (+),score=18.67 TRINITY_DN7698_c0_g1_i4:196-513(+)